MSEVCRRPCIAVKAAAGSSGAVAELVTSNLGRPAAITAAQIAAAVSLHRASLPDDPQTTKAFTGLMMMTLCLCCFAL
jgi:hypothetical protein